jgi:hypothetical protein
MQVLIFIGIILVTVFVPWLLGRLVITQAHFYREHLLRWGVGAMLFAGAGIIITMAWFLSYSLYLGG